MMNLVLRVRYILMKCCKITGKAHRNPECEYQYTDDFRNLWHWAPTQPETLKTSRSNGLTLSFLQQNSKEFISPCIISRTPIVGGSFVATTTTNPHEKIIHYFLLRRKSEEIGFKINRNHAYVICPHIDPRKFKIYKPDLEHTYEIEVDPQTGYIIWRIDGIAVFKVMYPTIEEKRIMIGMSATHSKLSPKDLPLSFKVRYVSIYHNHSHELKKSKEVCSEPL